MADTLATTVAMRLAGTRTVGLDQGTQSATHAVNVNLSWPDGTSASQADEVWSDQRTVNAGNNDDLDLTALTQVDDDGDTVRTVDLAKVKAIVIYNTSSSGNLFIDASVTNAWVGSGLPFPNTGSDFEIHDGGWFCWGDPTGAAVTDPGASIIRISGVTANQTYQICIIGDAA